ncbi:MAG TPA: hypothetical protein VM075_00745 [Anaerolineae bacterium]|nr:hypothetical protein [Anaerolineae bacterium]
MPLPFDDRMSWPRGGYGPDPAQAAPAPASGVIQQGGGVGGPRRGPNQFQGMPDEMLREKMIKEQIRIELQSMGIDIGNDILSLPIEQFIKWADRRKMEKKLETLQTQRSQNPTGWRPTPPYGGDVGAL